MDRIGVNYAAKTKQKNATNRIGVVYTKSNTRDMTDHIGGVYAGRQNERTRWVVWVSSMLKAKHET